jgi:hypothetical protein
MIHPMTLFVLMILASLALYETCRRLNGWYKKPRGDRK